LPSSEATATTADLLAEEQLPEKVAGPANLSGRTVAAHLKITIV
jgi:hypothetical protein